MFLIVYDFREQGFSVHKKAIVTERGCYDRLCYIAWGTVFLVNFAGFLCLLSQLDEWQGGLTLSHSYILVSQCVWETRFLRLSGELLTIRFSVG